MVKFLQAIWSKSPSEVWILFPITCGGVYLASLSHTIDVSCHLSRKLYLLWSLSQRKVRNTSLVAQWLRIHLTWRTQVRFLPRRSHVSGLSSPLCPRARALQQEAPAAETCPQLESALPASALGEASAFGERRLAPPQTSKRSLC